MAGTEVRFCYFSLVVLGLTTQGMLPVPTTRRKARDNSANSGPASMHVGNPSVRQALTTKMSRERKQGTASSRKWRGATAYCSGG